MALKIKTFKVFSLFLSLTFFFNASFSMEPAEETKEGYDGVVAPHTTYKDDGTEIDSQTCYELVVGPYGKFFAISPAKYFKNALREGPHRTITEPFLRRLTNDYGEENVYIEFLLTLAFLDTSKKNIFLRKVRYSFQSKERNEYREHAINACFQIASLIPFLFDLNTQSKMDADQVKKCFSYVGDNLVYVPKILELIRHNTVRPRRLITKHFKEVDLVRTGEKLFEKNKWLLFDKAGPYIEGISIN